ncbi:NAD(P)H-binding protein [Actinoplanes sp. NPDC023801]|uniref:NmrA family NAD(P)-binding protein n=1 Tax=Actinoplanes sp. NPDC023801 TaxID=3154595 RepID=UPI003405B05A
MKHTTVVLHGATGTQGRAILQRLLAAGHDVRAVTRRPRPDTDPAVQAVVADLLDLDALVAAYTGADAVVVQLPLDFSADAVRRADTMLAALGKAGVRRAVFNTGTGLPPAVPIGVPFIDARVRLAAGLPGAVRHATVLGPAGPYLENLVAPWSRSLIRDNGDLRYPLPAEAPVPWAAAADIGTEIAAQALAAAPAPARIVAGPAPVTGPELAAQLTSALGRPVSWQTIEPAEYARMLAPHLGETVAEGIAAAYAHPAPPPDPGLLTHGTTTPAAWAARQTF